MPGSMHAPGALAASCLVIVRLVRGVVLGATRPATNYTRVAGEIFPRYGRALDAGRNLPAREQQRSSGPPARAHVDGLMRSCPSCSVIMYRSCEHREQSCIEARMTFSARPTWRC